MIHNDHDIIFPPPVEDMLRKLKHHEAKLLKKVDFLDWKEERNLHHSTIVAKYGLSDRDEYLKYHKASFIFNCHLAATSNFSSCFLR